MITFENNFERDFWLARFAFYELYKKEHGLAQEPWTYADKALSEFRKRHCKLEQLPQVPEGAEQKCPQGLNFGCDTDTSDVCDVCKQWGDCSRQQAANVTFIQNLGKPDSPITKNECPHGLQFGRDTDLSNFCDTCEIWDACANLAVKNQKKTDV